MVLIWLLSHQSGPHVDNQEILVAVSTLVALFVALSPTTGGLLSVVDIRWLDRLIQYDIIPLRGSATIKIAGKVEVLLLNKSVAFVTG